MKSGQSRALFSPAGQTRFYPNLNPSAAIPVERDQIFRLNSFFDNYRLFRGKERAQYVPNSKFVFVRTAEGDTLLHPRYRHPAIAEGRPVLYAGEAQFDNGKLKWWSNGSGNYRPDPAHAAQAGLPLEQFYTYEQVLKGDTARPKTDNPDSLQAKMFLRRYPSDAFRIRHGSR